MSSQGTVELPVDRIRALRRGALAGIPAIIILLGAGSVFGRLHFVPTAFSNRVVDYAVAVLLIPIAVLAVVLLIRSVRWALLASWPGKVEVTAAAEWLSFRLGPFGQRQFSVRDLEIRYPFEAEDAANSAGAFESFLPEQQQRSTLLPHLRDLSSGAPIDRLIMKFASGTEAEIALRLGPLIERWQLAARSDD